MYSDRADWVSAIGTLERFRAEFPKDPYTSDALYSLGRAYENTGDIDSAVIVYSEIPELAE